jgi:hypothetical protein
MELTLMDSRTTSNEQDNTVSASRASSASDSTDQPPVANASAKPPMAVQTPLPPVPENYKNENPELYEAWVEHIKAGYENNDQIFQRILDAFMRSHNSTVIMNWILFAVGIGFFITSVILVLFQNSPGPAALFGGLSIGAFLTYFLTRPTQAVEENLQYVTWLGIIYNSYWTRLAWSFDEESAQAVLDEATEDAIVQLKDLVERHATSTGKRPNLPDMPGTSAD